MKSGKYKFMSITAFWCNCRQYIPAFRRKRTLCLECCKCLKFKFQTHVIFISHSFFVIVVWSNCWSYFFIFPWHLKMGRVLNCTSLLWKMHCVKSVRIRSFSVPYFPVFRLNTERYGVSLRIQSDCGKIRNRKTLNTDTFQALIY